ncbi:MAG: ABC transporter substrate-binding protein [Opitutales bacterium]
MKRALLFLALATVLALPFALRRREAPLGRADETLVIITSHNEAIRSEYGTAFREWYRHKTGRTIAVDWRVIGGTSEINRFLESEYVAAFRNYWTGKLGRAWSNEVQAAFSDPTVRPGADPALDTTAQAARRAFLDSSVSCGIDLFHGGGSYDYVWHAQAGRLVNSGIMQLHPDWFGNAVIPQKHTGETYWDPQGLWVGAVLSSYGILYNRDALQRLGLDHEPREWADLQDPRLAGEIALCDPTKSSSIAKAFENIIQQQMNLRWAALERETGLPRASLEARAVREGWVAGLRLIQRIGANARYFTDNSQKPPIDVMQGDSAAGMCIDFYGRSQEETAARRSGRHRLGYFSPVGGTVLSPDPIALLRGAPNPRAALAFIEYTLSLEGQALWDLRVGTPGGPRQYALRRLPIRRDFYRDEHYRTLRSDPDESPYAAGNTFIYHPEWTNGLMREIAFVTRVLCQDTHPELVESWRAIIAAGMPPDALAVLGDVSVIDYDQLNGRIKEVLNSKDKVGEVRLAHELAEHFREQYRRAAEVARAGRK